MSRKLVISVITAAALLLPVLPARAAVTIGSDLSAAPFGGLGCAGAACTWASTGIPGQQTTSPIDGVVVRWRLRVGETGLGGQQIRLKVVRPTGGGEYTAVDVSDTHGPLAASATDTTHLFPTTQLIKAGDGIALDADSANVGNLVVDGSTASTTELRWDPALPIGTSRPPNNTFTSGEILLNADVEPDADCDGLGDETQDPQVVSGGCTPTNSSPPHGGGVAALAGGVVKTKGKSVSLTFSCPAAGGDCSSNSVSLRSAKPVSIGTAETAKNKRIAVGSASFTIPAGTSQAVTVPLTKRAQKVLRQRRKLATTATITGGGHSTTASLTIKLR
jgi:hypothetical protein